MSVAIGIPHPRDPGPFTLTARYNTAGTTMPPTAATTGRAARFLSRNSPVDSSRRISRPTTRKKIVISPSFTHKRSAPSIAKPPSSMESVSDQNDR
jgi:hypothetical protein